MKVFIIADCMDSEKDFHEKGSTPSIDKNKEQKLFDLGLVEEFDIKKHGAQKKDINPKLDELLIAKEVAESKVIVLYIQIKKLKAFIDLGKDTAKSSYPSGYKDYLASLED